MTWQFVAGALDANRRTRDDLVFIIAIEPKKLGTMMDDLELKELSADDAREMADNIRKMEANRLGILVGRDKLAQINKRAGERIKLFGVNFRDIDLDFDIVGTFPSGRYDQAAVMNRDYLNDAIDTYARTHSGRKHPMADKSLNLVWVRVSDTEKFSRIADQIARSPLYANPAVKCETASSGVAAFLDAYRDLIWGMRWLLSPAILVTLALVISNAISISVRERRMEMAVLKVLGFRPGQLLVLVLGEALVIGVLAGLASAGATYFAVNEWLGGVKFPIAFIPVFFIPSDAFWWGLGIGTITSLAGSIMPAWSARSVRVADVFSKVA
jgi:putative ABC transport system permease protein